MASVARGVSSPMTARPFTSSASSSKCSFDRALHAAGFARDGSRAARQRVKWPGRAGRATAWLGDGQQSVGGLAHGRDDHDGLAVDARLDDAGDALDGFGRFDGGAAEFHYDHRAIRRACLRRHQLSVEHGRAGRAANGVVAEATNFQSSTGHGRRRPTNDRHAVLALDIAARLRAVFSVI